MSVYDLESVNLPKLQGAALSLFAATLETPGIGGVLLSKLAADAGVGTLFERKLSEAPRPMPLEPARLPIDPEDEPSVDLSELDQLAPRAAYCTSAELAKAYGTGETKPTEIAQRAWAAIEAREPELDVFTARDQAYVMRMARESDERWAKGAPIGPLDGVPVAVKDEVDMIPFPTTVGTTFMATGPAKEDSTVVARLRAAGAVLLGKATMHEIGINPNGANPHYGVVRNPYDLARDPGGSSSGSAAAVAAGFCPLAVGADGGGSIRIPAGLCGAVGLKATYGRVSEHGAAPLCWTVGHVGPIGASVYDVALGYALMAGPDAHDPNTLVQPPVTLEGASTPNARGLKVGVFRPWFEHAQVAIVEACDEALKTLTDAGAEIVQVELPDLDLIRVAHAVTILSEMATTMDQYKEHRKELASHVRVNLSVARHFGATDYVRAQRVRARAMAHMDRVFSSVDVLATPTTAVTAPVIPITRPDDTWSDLTTVTELMRYAFLQNLTGHPAISVPVGYDADGLPIGFELTGRHWEEATLLRAAGVVEAAVEHRAAPGACALLGG